MEIKNAASFQPTVTTSEKNQPNKRNESASATDLAGLDSRKPAEINDKELIDAVKKSNDMLDGRSAGLEFSIDDDSGRTIVKLIDKQTDEILRQYPSKQMLALAKDLEKFQGALVSEKV